MRAVERVRVTGHPDRFPWLGDLVGKKGEVLQERRWYLVKVPGEHAVWLSEAYVEEAESD